MSRHRDERGQVIVLFALALVAVIAAAGLLIDVGFGWSNRRDGQSAADTAALGAAVAAADGGSTTAAGQNVAAANGYPTTYQDCAGNTRNDGVIINHPPLSGPHTLANDPTGADNYVEVIVNRVQQNYFSGLIGQGCWPVSARAVAEIAASGVASCSFCSLNRSTKNHTLLLQNGATLRVDGDIYTNSINGGASGDCVPGSEGSGMSGMGGNSGWQVCGDAFDIFGDPPTPPAYISAKSIAVAGGWETHDENVVMADEAIWPDYSTSPPTYTVCPSGKYPDPPAQTQTSNVCIHRPQIADPLDDPAFPQNRIQAPSASDYPVPTAASCPSGTHFPSGGAGLTISTNATICPGRYPGGISITAGTTTMLPGVYYIAGNGFHVSGTANLDGSSGVMIYSTIGGSVDSPVNILPDPDVQNPIDENRLNPTVTIATNSNPYLIGGKGVKYTVTVSPTASGMSGMGAPATPNLNGILTVYDGPTQICGTSVVTNQAKAQSFECTITYGAAGVGTHGITGLFRSTDTCTDNTCWNSRAVALDPRQVVNENVTPAGSTTIVTSGNVKLSGIKSGPYKGLVIFSDRSSDEKVTISPGSGLDPCTPVTNITVNGVTAPEWAIQQATKPTPCGALGGIDGTIYAPNEDALVEVTASGVADLQVIAGKILITSQATARFSYNPSKFAGGSIRLVE